MSHRAKLFAALSGTAVVSSTLAAAITYWQFRSLLLEQMRITASDFTYAAARSGFRYKHMGPVKAKGRVDGVNVFAVEGFSSSRSPSAASAELDSTS